MGGTRRRRIIDISVPNRPGLPGYPGDPAFGVERVRRLADGDVCELARLTLGNHTGTHVDAPAHVLPGGACLGGVALDRLVGDAVVADLRGRSRIDAAALAALAIERGDILLCRTDDSWRWDTGFGGDATHLSEDGADLLVTRGVVAVGIDGLSVDRLDAPDLPVHRRLLGAGVVVIEGLDLRAAEPGRYTLVCLPLSLPELDGAPARAVLLV
jgi:arylformamidase